MGLLELTLNCWIFNMQLLKFIFAKQASLLLEYSDKFINNVVCSNPVSTMSITNPTTSQSRLTPTTPYRPLTLPAAIRLVVLTPGRPIMQGADPQDTAFSCNICGKVSASGEPASAETVDQATDPGSL